MSELRIGHTAVRRGGRVVLQPAELVLALPGALAVVGINGSGKSSLFMCLTGTLHRHCGSGAVSIAGRPARLAYVPQVPAFPRWLRVEQVSALYGASFDDLTQRMTGLHLDELAGRRGGALSVGQRQTLAIALALAREAEVTFLDEPFAALDFRRRIGALELLRQARDSGAGRSFVLSSQAAADLIGLCDDYVVIRAGRYAFRGTSQELAARNDGGDIERELLHLLL